MALKKTHFGERLEALIVERFYTQGEFAKAVGRKQPTIARWVGQQDFAKNESVRKLLHPLARLGINPEYLWNPLISDWKGPVVNDVSEIAWYEVTRKLAALEAENRTLLAEVERNRELIKKLEGKGQV